jgi:uncharacterized OsmC-like protein
MHANLILVMLACVEERLQDGFKDAAPVL